MTIKITRCPAPEAQPKTKIIKFKCAQSCIIHNFRVPISLALPAQDILLLLQEDKYTYDAREGVFYPPDSPYFSRNEDSWTREDIIRVASETLINNTQRAGNLLGIYYIFYFTICK